MTDILEPISVILSPNKNEILVTAVGLQGATGASGGGGGGLTWQAISGDFQLLANTAYACTGLALQQLTLPTSPAFGDRLAVYGSSTGLFRIVQNVGQFIRFGNKVTTTGITGRIDSLAEGDVIELVFAGAGAWAAVNSSGNFEVT